MLFHSLYIEVKDRIMEPVALKSQHFKEVADFVSNAVKKKSKGVVIGLLVWFMYRHYSFGRTLYKANIFGMKHQSKCVEVLNMG